MAHRGMFFPGVDGKAQEGEREDASPKYLEWDLCAVHNASLRAPVASLSYARRSWWELSLGFWASMIPAAIARVFSLVGGGLLLKRTR